MLSARSSRPPAAAVLAALTVLLLLLASACRSASLDAPVPATSAPAQPESSVPMSSVSAAAERDCTAREATDVPAHVTAEAAAVAQSSPDTARAASVQFSVALSRALYDCAHEVGLAFADDSEAILTLAERGLRGPLLLVESWSAPEPMAEIRRLAPERIVAAGFNQQRLQRQLSGIDTEFELDWVPVDPNAALPLRDAPAALVWVVHSAERAAVLGSLGTQIGAAAVAVGAGEDLRALPPQARDTLRSAAHVELGAALDTEAAWQLEVVRRGEELPGGGLLLFEPGRARRLVAMYGHPATSQLGVLGEQGPLEGIERVRSIARDYGADGSDVILAFEIIATVASANPGGDGDYSNETALDVIRPWIDMAAENDMYVVLDLQSGRTDFLTQAKRYAELLRHPHVGLALDPEWRLRPGEVHLRQVGTVDAAEINPVVGWLAGLVREEALPQKLLIMHQFSFSMITNRDQVATPAELAVMIHMDGQGPIATKYSTWEVLTTQPDAGRFYWGWKNFYDEDFPTPTPQQVLALRPSPLFVSYQ
ncbi:hypothetical protein [Candidatus Poriferisodalis sp.]|uniref:hypothetical protein n=1 Tax=Candidatus Poriferisodalis sp. TaxID=3101277 RepID=UPI003B01735A